MPTIEAAANKILQALFEVPRERGASSLSGDALAKATGLDPDSINDAVQILQYAGWVDWLRTMGTAPYSFYTVELTPRGRYETERLREAASQNKTTRDKTEAASRPPVPRGSPFGFTVYDWEHVALRKANSRELSVVLGYQFQSAFYESESLIANIRAMMEHAVNSFNQRNPGLSVSLSFAPLAAGYGEHLFNEIARDIISSDIAIFETSDRNPNVMIEMGVALTWGVNILPIREATSPELPSDLSGQTYAEYRNSAAAFTDANHSGKVERMGERVVGKKSA